MFHRRNSIVPRKRSKREVVGTVARSILLGYITFFLIIVVMIGIIVFGFLLAFITGVTVEGLSRVPDGAQRLLELVTKALKLPSIYWWVAVFFFVFAVAFGALKAAEGLSWPAWYSKPLPPAPKRKRLVNAREAMAASDSLNKRRAELRGLNQGGGSRSFNNPLKPTRPTRKGRR